MKVASFKLEIKGYQKVINDLKEVKSILSEIGAIVSKDDFKSADKVTQSVKQSTEAAKQYKKQTETVRQEAARLRKEQEALIISGKQSSDQFRENAARLATIKNAQNQAREATKQAVREIEGQESAYKRMSNRLNDLRKRYKDLAASEDDTSEETEKLRQEITKLDAELKEIDASTGQFYRNVGNYPNAFEGFAPFLTGITEKIDSFGEGLESLANRQSNMAANSAGITAFFASIQAGITRATSAAYAFIATPIGAALTALAAIGVAAKAWWDYNDAISESVLLTHQITGLTGEAATRVESLSVAISDTLGTGLQETLRASNSIVKTFGGTYEEALDGLALGLIQAGDQQDEFLDSVREYSTFFADAGFSFQEFASLINTGIDEGVYSDKLPDAIKEFELSITEATTASRDALNNAFGSQFTTQLLDNVANGSLTAKDALFEVAEEAENIGINVQESAQLTADLFRGAGEDAGGALEIFRLVNKSLSEQQKELSNIEQAQLDSVESLERLENAQRDAFKSDNFIAFRQDLTNGWRNIKSVFFEAIAFIGDTFVTVNNRMEQVAAGFFNVLLVGPTIFRELFNTAGTALGGIITAFKDLSLVAGRALKFDFDGAKQAANQFVNNIRGAREEVGRDFENIQNTITNAFQAGVDATKKRQEEYKESLVEQNRFEEEMAKKREARAKKLAEEEKERERRSKFVRGSIADIKDQINLLQNELENTADETLIAKISDQLVDLEGDLDIAEKKLEDFYAKALGRDLDFKSADKIPIQELIPITSDSLDLADPLKGLPEQVMDSIREKAEKIRSERADVSFLQDILGFNPEDIERLKQEALNVASNVSNQVFQIRENVAQRQFESETAALEARYNREIEAAEGNAALQEDLEAELAAEREKIQNEANEKEKQRAISQAIINGALAATAILTVPDFSFGVQTAIRLGFVAATTAAQVATIRSQEFEEGGLLKGPSHNQGGIPFTIGGVPGFEAEGGEFIIKKKAVTKETLPILKAINGHDPFAFTRNFQEGGRLPQVPGSFVDMVRKQSVSISPEGIKLLADAVKSGMSGVEESIERGAQKGTSMGLNDANRRMEREQRLTENTQL